MRALSIVLMLLLLLSGPLCAAGTKGPKKKPVAISPTSTSVNRPSLGDLLKQCGFEYAETTPNTYTLTVEGKQVARHRLFVASYEGLVLIGTVAARKADLPASGDLHVRLLRFNHDFDRVKIALDDDHDLVVRVDLSLRLLDAAELKANIEQVAASAEEVRGLLVETALQK